MKTVSDVFAFATSQADYWDEFFNPQDYGDILTDEEKLGLDAARTHVKQSVYELLKTCADKLPTAVKGLPAKKWLQFEPTVRRRKVELAPPTAWGKRLYRIEFELWLDEKEGRILLYGSLCVKKASADDLLAALQKNGANFDYDGLLVSAQGVALHEGETFDAIADKVVGSVASLFEAGSSVVA